MMLLYVAVVLCKLKQLNFVISSFQGPVILLGSGALFPWGHRRSRPGSLYFRRFGSLDRSAP